MNFHDKAEGGGRGGGPEPSKKDDIVCEQRCISSVKCMYSSEQ